MVDSSSLLDVLQNKTEAALAEKARKAKLEEEKKERLVRKARRNYLAAARKEASVLFDTKQAIMIKMAEAGIRSVHICRTEFTHSGISERDNIIMKVFRAAGLKVDVVSVYDNCREIVVSW